MSDKVFIDSNIWLYATIRSQDAKKSDIAACLIEDASHIILTTQVINEIAVNLIKKAGKEEAFIREFITELDENYDVRALDMNDLKSASFLRSRYHFSYWDSLIVASALTHGCSALYTEDLQHHLTVNDKLVITNPFE